VKKEKRKTEKEKSYLVENSPSSEVRIAYFSPVLIFLCYPYSLVATEQ
jgi:hypothetical protein